MFRWVVEVLPGTLIGHFDRNLRRRRFEIENPDNHRPAAAKYFCMISAWVSLTIGALLAPPLLGLLAVLLFVGLLPIPFSDSAARVVQRVLASIIGDSYAFLGNPLMAAALADRVGGDIRRLAETCDRIVIAAHSQGGVLGAVAPRPPCAHPGGSHGDRSLAR